MNVTLIFTDKYSINCMSVCIIRCTIHTENSLLIIVLPESYSFEPTSLENSSYVSYLVSNCTDHVGLLVLPVNLIETVCTYFLLSDFEVLIPSVKYSIYNRMDYMHLRSVSKCFVDCGSCSFIISRRICHLVRSSTTTRRLMYLQFCISNSSPRFFTLQSVSYNAENCWSAADTPVPGLLITELG